MIINLSYEFIFKQYLIKFNEFVIGWYLSKLYIKNKKSKIKIQSLAKLDSDTFSTVFRTFDAFISKNIWDLNRVSVNHELNLDRQLCKSKYPKTELNENYQYNFQKQISLLRGAMDIE